MKLDWNENYISIIKKKNGPKTFWQVGGMLPHRNEKGKRLRIRKRFKSEADAVDFANDQKDRARRFLVSGQHRRTRLTELEEADAIAALQVLSTATTEGDHTLTNAAIYYLSQLGNIVKQKITIDDAVEKWIKNPAFVRNSDLHQYQFTRRINRFRDAYTTTSMDEFTTDGIEEYIFDENRDVSEKERLNDYACVHAFFNYAVDKEWVTKNVVTKVPKPKPEGADPVALSIPEVKRLMEVAVQVDGGSMIPYFALAIFSALRPSEILRLDWQKFVWDDIKPCVVVDGKGKRRRSVELHETCIKWVKPHAQKDGKVTPTNVKKLFNFCRAVAGYRVAKSTFEGVDKTGFDKELKGLQSKKRPTWVRDVMRHTGITYFLKIKNDKDYVANWAGNSPSIIDSNYRAVEGVTASTSEKFWNILPNK